MNYTKELKNDQIFVLAYGEDKLETQGHTNKDGTALWGMTTEGEEDVMSSTRIERSEKNDSRS